MVREHLVLGDVMWPGRMSERDVRAMNGFLFAVDKPVMTGKHSGGPESHLSCELNSKQNPLDGMELEATEVC